MTSLPRLAAVALALAPLAASLSLSAAATAPVAAAAAVRAAPFDVVEAEIQACRQRTGRDYAACEAETEGKALIREAELALAAPAPLPGAGARPRLQ
jgi:hypothetical protein